MSKNKIQTDFVAGIDIGSNYVRVVVGQMVEIENNQFGLQVVGAINVDSEGMQKGNITSIEDTISSVSAALEKTENMIGSPVDNVWVGVSGVNVILQDSRGVVAVSRGNGEISEEDVERVVEAAGTIATPLNYEILHVLPQSFSVDGQTGIKDPVGMTGMRLEVDAKIIYAVNSHIKNLTKTIYRAGLDINDFILTILAVGEAVTTPKQRELGVAVVSIGGSTTDLVVYEEGDMIYTSNIPIGSMHITNDLALGLRTSIEIAERVKNEYGYCISEDIPKKESLDLIDFGSELNEKVSLRYVSEIVEARVGEILEKIDEKLNEIERSGLLPAGVIFVGGGSKIKGLTELAKKDLSLPSSLGRVRDVSSITEKINDLSFMPSVGLIKWGARIASNVGRRKHFFHFFGKASEKTKKIFKFFMP